MYQITTTQTCLDDTARQSQALANMWRDEALSASETLYKVRQIKALMEQAERNLMRHVGD